MRDFIDLAHREEFRKFITAINEPVLSSEILKIVPQKSALESVHKLQ
jgi:hypothetical protein